MATYVVAVNGNDTTGTGSAVNPYATIGKADSGAGPGDTVLVNDGTYTTAGSGVTALVTAASGNASNRITYKSVSRWGAKIRNTGAQRVWQHTGSYCDFLGFDVSTSDGSADIGLLCYGSFNSYRQNRVHDIPAPDAATTGGAGIDPHYNTGSETGNDVIGNLIYNIGTVGVGVQLVHGIYHQTGGGKLQNNIIANIVNGWGIKLTYYVANPQVTNNLIVYCAAGGLLVVGDATIGIKPDYVYFANNSIRDCYGGFGSAIYESPSGQGTGPNNRYTHNNIFGGTITTQMITGTIDTTTNLDPKMVDYRQNGLGDYHLLATSPLIDAGSATNAPLYDYDGVLRAQGAGIDIGPYEFVPAQTSKRGGLSLIGA